jgi:hypothetical protein
MNLTKWVIEDVLSNTKDVYLSKHYAYLALDWYKKNYPDLKLVLRKWREDDKDSRSCDLQIYVCCLVRQKVV